eukprot:scaffold4680_cov164-Skeletonema_marinoi.AAC.19
MTLTTFSSAQTKRLETLLGLAPNLAGFLAFILQSYSTMDHSALAKATFSILFLAFACFLMISWRVYLALTAGGLVAVSSSDSERRNEKDGKEGLIFERRVILSFFLGVICFYVGMLLVVFDFVGLPLEAKITLTVITGYFVVFAIKEHIHVLQNICEEIATAED